MNKQFLLLLVAGFLLTLCGCKTVTNTAMGVGMTAYGFGKGVVDDSYDSYKALDTADRWFQKYYW